MPLSFGAGFGVNRVTQSISQYVQCQYGQKDRETRENG
ncbi:protein of unknown function [Nitratireductor aquimarinus]